MRKPLCISRKSVFAFNSVLEKFNMSDLLKTKCEAVNCESSVKDGETNCESSGQDGEGNSELQAKRPDLLMDVLSVAPANWKKDQLIFTGTLGIEVPVHGSERTDVLAALPGNLRENATVYEIHNPFMWGRYVFRREQLLTRGVKLNERRRYHPIFEVDRRTVKKYNLDWRRYCDRFREKVQENKKPILFNDPFEAMHQVYKYCSKNRRDIVLVVVNVLETQTDNVAALTKDRDTEYYPQYFIGLN